MADEVSPNQLFTRENSPAGGGIGYIDFAAEDANGILTIPSFVVTSAGNQLVIQPYRFTGDESAQKSIVS